MYKETHPSNPPANAIDFSTQQSDGFELANWKQTDKPNVQSTQEAAYKVLKIGNQYLVIWARKIITKVNLFELKKGTAYKLFDTDAFTYTIVGNYPTYVSYSVNVDGAKIMRQRKSNTPVMVTLVNK